MSSQVFVPSQATVSPKLASRNLIFGVGLMRRRILRACECRHRFSHLFLSGRVLFFKLILFFSVFLSISAFASAQLDDQQDQEPQTGQTGQTGQSPQSQTPMPLKRPVTTPQITNVTPAQEAAEQGNDSKKKSLRLEPPLPPEEPDLEFQEFVANSLGVKLPIFGQNLFENVPSTFAPLDRVQVPADYIIGPDDELLIKAWGQVAVNWRAAVDRTGEVYIPQVGTFNVAGVRYGDLHDYLQAQVGRIFKNFQLSVSLGRLRSMQVFVVGQVKRPGSYTISSLSSLIDALFASGGPSKRGSMRRIQLKRDGNIVTTFDLYDLIVNGDKSRDT